MQKTILFKLDVIIYQRFFNVKLITKSPIEVAYKN